MSRKSTIFWLLFVPDVLVLYVGLYIALAVRYGQLPTTVTFALHARAFTVLFGLWLLVFFVHQLFEIGLLRRYAALIFNIALSMMVNTLVAISYFYFQPELVVTPRRLLLILVVVTFVLLVGWYLLVKYFVKNRLTQALYILTFSNELAELETEIAKHDYLGFRVLARVNESGLFKTDFVPGSGIIVPGSLETKPEVVSRLYELRKQGVRFYNHTAFYEDLVRKVYLSRVQEGWFLENINYSQKRFYELLKRLTDLVFALFGLVFYVCTFPVFALVIRLSSPGPILFIQDRVGLHGKVFRVYKYRTMRADNPSNTWTSPQDPRITRLGKVLRMSRLDELPQCVNLFLGNMSLVGPRPEQPNLVEALRQAIPFYDERHMVKPGLTGWAQINNTYASTIEESRVKLQYDLYYIKHRSTLFDLEIILKTLYYVLSWRGR